VSNSYISELSTFARFLTALPGYLRNRMEPEQARSRLTHALEQRENNFLNVVERGVYGNPGSPYLALLRSAGAELGDVKAVELPHNRAARQVMQRMVLRLLIVCLLSDFDARWQTDQR
jgi:hypothetical protein